MSPGTVSAGRILTFYSYKGGTGRSMALANMAWILATNGYRVLAIDWDLEAPGLHRYFHPFLDDPEVLSSTGLIDYFSDFATDARVHGKTDDSSGAWCDRYRDLIGYASSLDWEFPSGGKIDFVPAGKQGAAYASRVTVFDWAEFYSKLGGGVLLESIKIWMRQEYDYVLIDSRTGISDTSGICTVQMPDELVVCFTLNRQSMFGAAAAARSAFEQRRKPSSEPGLRVWPLATRIELGETDRLSSARRTAQQLFQSFLGHLSRSRRQYYWGQMEVQYQPYYAYEEVLAVFKDMRRTSKTLLADLEAMTRNILGIPIQLGEMADEKRTAALKLYVGEGGGKHEGGTPRIFVNYSWTDKELVDRLVSELTQQFGQNSVAYDSNLLKAGDDWSQELTEALQNADLILSVLGPGRDPDGESAANIELRTALSLGKRVIPVLLSHSDFGRLPEPLRIIQAVVVEDFESKGFLELIRACRPYSTPLPTVSVPEQDPQKGKWGGRAAANGLTVSASVTPVSSDWFAIDLQVNGQSLTDAVTFHLHPTFEEPVRTVIPENRVARLLLQAWGSFTVGVVADHGRTILELDLATLPDAPHVFRER